MRDHPRRRRHAGRPPRARPLARIARMADLFGHGFLIGSSAQGSIIQPHETGRQPLMNKSTAIPCDCSPRRRSRSSAPGSRLNRPDRLTWAPRPPSARSPRKAKTSRTPARPHAQRLPPAPDALQSWLRAQAGRARVRVAARPRPSRGCARTTASRSLSLAGADHPRQRAPAPCGGADGEARQQFVACQRRQMDDAERLRNSQPA